MFRISVFLALGSNIAAFFIFLYPKTYPKVSAESVIRTPDPLLVNKPYLKNESKAPNHKSIFNTGLNNCFFRVHLFKC